MSIYIDMKKWEISYLSVQLDTLRRKFCFRDFPSRPVIRSLPANAGDTGLTPVLEDSTFLGSTKPMCHNY